MFLEDVSSAPGYTVNKINAISFQVKSRAME